MFISFDLIDVTVKTLGLISWRSRHWVLLMSILMTTTKICIGKWIFSITFTSFIVPCREPISYLRCHFCAFLLMWREVIGSFAPSFRLLKKSNSHTLFLPIQSTFRTASPAPIFLYCVSLTAVSMLSIVKPHIWFQPTVNGFAINCSLIVVLL